MGDLGFLAPAVLPPFSVFDTGTVIVDADVTATADAIVLVLVYDLV